MALTLSLAVALSVPIAFVAMLWRRAAGGPRLAGVLEDLPVRVHLPDRDRVDRPRSDRSGPGPAHAPSDSLPLVVFFTSDSGWLQLNHKLPDALARAGYPTVAWNSLRYYLKERSPEEAARDLERILDHCSGSDSTRSWSAVGYSFGAGVLPFLVNRLSEEWRARLESVVYLAYPGSAMFRFKPSGWLLRLDQNALPAKDEVGRLPAVPSLCVAGEKDPIRDCRSIEGFGVRRHLLDLGHGLHPRTSEVSRLVIETLERGRSTRLGPRFKGVT